VVCSPHNFELARRYGATQCFDYRSPDCVKDIQAYTKRALALVIDCVGTVQSANLCYDAIGRAGGQYVGLNAVPTEVRKSRRAVKGSWAIGPSASGEGVDLGGGMVFPPDAEARSLVLEVFAQVEVWVRKDMIKNHPIRTLEVGDNWMTSVLDGLRTLQKGEVSGEKLVVQLPR
jgi:NADPH:quinone reductase-like Zn-dependent oxidoreductase